MNRYLAPNIPVCQENLANSEFFPTALVAVAVAVLSSAWRFSLLQERKRYKQETVALCGFPPSYTFEFRVIQVLLKGFYSRQVIYG
jgi:hypothetical protein